MRILFPGSRPLIIAVLCLLGVTPFATGQQEFELTEEDTWAPSRDTADPASPEGQLAAIARALAAEEYGRAKNLATQWIERHGRHPDVPTAYLYRGDAERGRRNYYEALFDYEYVARMYPGSEAFVTALERELEIARLYAGGLKRKVWGMRLVSASEEAEELFIRIQERLPGSSLAEEAGMELGDYYFEQRRMELAAEAYALFIENYPRSRQVSKARRRLIYAHLAAFKGPEFDASGLYEARAKLRELRAIEPATAEQVGATALLRRIDESDARKMLVTAEWYLDTGDTISAELTIRRLLRRYERTNAARDAVRRVMEILPKLPESVLAQAPDYEAYRQGLLGPEPGGAGAPTEPEEAAENGAAEGTP
ncbi:MAG: outer membrane protein assembly factor BamD [Planctomycetota bacterium]|jgi:outer membrane protein assembly factor BamD (BamD/ComL family)